MPTSELAYRLLISLMKLIYQKNVGTLTHIRENKHIRENSSLAASQTFRPEQVEMEVRTVLENSTTNYQLIQHEMPMTGTLTLESHMQ